MAEQISTHEKKGGVNLAAIVALLLLAGFVAYLTTDVINKSNQSPIVLPQLFALMHDLASNGAADYESRLEKGEPITVEQFQKYDPDFKIETHGAISLVGVDSNLLKLMRIAYAINESYEIHVFTTSEQEKQAGVGLEFNTDKANPQGKTNVVIKVVTKLDDLDSVGPTIVASTRTAHQISSTMGQNAYNFDQQKALEDISKAITTAQSPFRFATAY